ncbi:hydramacin-1-like [Physella acuta]|uniref:hydramacin-1-like n=1 Tax=Physella acuta TaxID=109671 RepID=UPI0027DBD1E8|nr:hydramacin-1-like [Physella acuta]
MTSSLKISILFTLLALTVLETPVAGASLSDCYETWSRCSRWSSFLTGILWKSCDDRCKKDFKKRGGRCVKVPSKCPTSKKAYQCQCY